MDSCDGWLVSLMNRNQHNLPEDVSYREEDTLRRLYHDERLSTFEIAERFGVEHSTISKWMKRNDVEPRSTSEAQSNRTDLLKSPACYITDERGYSLWRTQHNDEQHTVYVHRLAAVAWNGFDAVAKKDVHHKNGIKWDNRESNLEPLTPSQHRKRHTSQGDYALE